jgi:hypothetical protein
LESSYDLYYKCVLALASVVNYDHKHDATISSVTC